MTFSPPCHFRRWLIYSWLLCAAPACGDIAVDPLTEPAAAPDSCDPPPFERCNNQCVHLLTNAEHCGACDSPCQPSFECAGGECQPRE